MDGEAPARHLDKRTFSYNTLTDSFKDFRILSSKPSPSVFDLVECQLDEVGLDRCSSFFVHEPVDHEGSAEDDHVILCNRTLLCVSEGTHFFLRTMRSQKDPRMHRTYGVHARVLTTTTKKRFRSWPS